MPATPYPSDSSLAARLDASRQELLDLSLRNPLLNFRLSKSQGVAVVQEDSAAVYERLVQQGKSMYFQAAPSARPGAALSAKAVEATAGFTNLEAAEEGVSAEELNIRRQAYLQSVNSALQPAAEPEVLTEEQRQALLTDNKLQTAEPLAVLERRLQTTYYTARTSLEETGANILYLALGMLRWYEADSSDEARLAPLVLVPVLLERGGVTERFSAGERFKLRYTGAEVEANLSLQARLQAGFGRALPDFEEESSLADYFAAVQAAVAGLPRWQVEANSIVLGFFSFGKFLLYRDLDPSTWPAGQTPLEHPTITALLGPDTGFQDAPPTVDDEAFLDTESPAAELHQVLDGDSSQLLALLAVHEGRNLVIQGPPGTGKSQTIANLLAEAIGAGKTVLFVAEKMAALEVVKRRLDALGLGAACLELHSHKANKKALHDELRLTLGLGRPASAAQVQSQVEQLPRYRQALNDYVLGVNAPLGRSRLSAQQVAGELLLLAGQRGPTELPRLAFATLPDWTDADAARAEALAARLQATLQKIGLPKSLLFWGSELTVLLPAAQAALLPQLQESQTAVAELRNAAEALARQLGLPLPTGRAAAEALLPAARHAQLAPPLDRTPLAHPAWTEQAGRIQEVLQAGTAFAELHRQYDATLLPEAWGQPLLAERAALLEYDGKWWNFLSGDYRRARKRLQSLWRGTLHKSAAELVPVIDAIHDANRYAQVITEANTLASPLFGPAWLGLRSDWPALRRLADYVLLTHQRIARQELPAELLTYLSQSASQISGYNFNQQTPLPFGFRESSGEGLGEGLAPLLATLETALTHQRSALQAVADALQLNEARRFGPQGRLQFQPFAVQEHTLAAWAADLPALRLTTEWNNVAAEARNEQFPELLLLAESWAPAAQLLALAVRQAWLEHLQQLAYEQHPALRRFEQAAHEELISHFRQADRESLYHNRIRAMRRHYEQLPSPQAGGQMLVLKNEFAKKTRHLPLRRLMQQAGRAVQAIKPVFMMSPLSVAGYLPPGAVEFDLVVFDEASQVKPVDALGAIARGRQLVVVGDSKQLPPTSFFDSLTGAGEDADEENVTADMQSILELCKARQMPERMLRWHYRSRHQSLIAASNHLFYHDHLVVFPSPGGHSKLGLAYHYLPDTHYERGSTRTNPREAEAVAVAVLQHARATPHLTLGVVAFSMAQRQAIQDALDRQRRQQPDAEEFFNRHPHEPFFIKNLENVQGDERDVILISVGYGRTAEGALAMNFGPLNGEGGERRLNVLITRAKQRCEVFTNLTADDLDLSRTTAKGVAALRTFLAFAQHGRLDQSAETKQEVEAPFEDVVAQALTARGYQLHSRVGSQGFYLDLAVVDSEQTGRYVLGIACDGAMYKRARSARDRDRLREEVLTGMGWRLHRIWSTDWFRNPAQAAERAVAAIEAARHAAAQELQPEPAAAYAPATSRAPLVREESSRSATNPYQLAQLPPTIQQRELHQHPVGRLAAWVTEVVGVESPVHVDEVTRRLALAAGASQVGSRIRASVQAAIKLATTTRGVRQQADFLWTPSMREPTPRDRSALPPASRKLGFVAPEELAAAVLAVVRGGFSVEQEAVPPAAARLLGFARLSEEQRELISGAIDKLLANGSILDKNGVLTPGNS